MNRSGKRIFEVLVREQHPALLAFVRACVADPAAAEDIVQESFVAAWEQFHRYDEDRSFAAWLRGIARNKILTHRRSAAVAQRHLRILADDQIGSISRIFNALTAGRGDSFDGAVAALRDCIKGLRDDQRDLLERVYRRSESCVTMAASVGVTVEAARKRLQRARDLLRHCVERKLQLEALSDA